MSARSTEDLEQKYNSQLKFLERSAKAFDDGMEDEDVRMAHSIRVLFHQTKASHSIVNQLGLELKLTDTSCPLTLNNLVGEMPLVQTGIGGKTGTKFFAPLEDAIRKNLIPFENWWSQLVFRHQNSHKFSRKRLVLQLANKEGGSHVDPSLTDEFEDLKRDAFGVDFYNADEKIERNDVVATTMRQIAYEVLESLTEGYRSTRADQSFGVITAGGGVQEGAVNSQKIARNDLCPCESGLKFKKCHYLPHGDL